MLYTRFYESTAELVEKATASRGRDPYNGWFHREDFVGRDFGSWGEVTAAANGTWEDGVKEVEAMVEELSSIDLPKPVSKRRRGVWAEDGDEFDNDRFRAGQECWRAMRRETVTAPGHITIIAQVGALSDVPASHLMWRGAAAIVIADLLEQAGYRVTLHMANKARMDDKTKYSYRVVKVKDACEPVNLANLVNVASPWFYRSVFIQEHSTEPAFGRMGDDDRGATKPLTQFEVDQVDPEAVLIQSVYNRATAVSKVREVIESLSNK